MPEDNLIESMYMDSDCELGEDEYAWFREYEEWENQYLKFDVDDFANEYFGGEIPA